MKNYLIKHANRRIDNFLRLAQQTSNLFDTASKQVNKLFSESGADKEIIKFYKTESVRMVLDALKDMSKLSPNDAEFKNSANSLHLLISELTSEVNDAVSNPDLDEELAELGESDFYLDFEEVLLNVQEQLESSFGVDTESEEYREADTSLMGNFITNETHIDDDKRKKDTEGQITDGKEVKGFTKRVQEQIEDYGVDIKEYQQTPKMIALGQEIMDVLVKEKLPLAIKADDIRKLMSDAGITHFIKKDILDPNVLKKEYHPDGRVIRKKLWINVVNPEWKAQAGDVISRVEKINGKVLHLFATLKRLGAEFNQANGVYPDLNKVSPEFIPLYKKLIDLQNTLYIKQNVMSHAGKSGPVTKSLKYIISRLVDSRNNPFDIHKTTNAEELANIQDFMDNISSKTYAWVNKSKYMLNQESGKFILANLDLIQQNSNHVTTDLNNTFFQDILFKSFIESREGDFSSLAGFLNSLEKVAEIKAGVAMLAEQGLALQNRITARDKTLTNNDLNEYKNINAKLKVATKQAMALYKDHTRLAKDLGKTLTKLSSQLAEGDETFENPKLNEVAAFLKELYVLRKHRTALAQVVMRLENDKNASLTEEESNQSRNLFGQINKSLDILLESSVVSWGEDKVSGRGGSIKTSLSNMKEACRNSIALFNERVSGE